MKEGWIEKLSRALVLLSLVAVMTACSQQPADHVADLIDNLKSPDAEIRSHAARDLSEHDEPRVHDALLSAASDPSTRVRVSTLEALGKLKVRRALPVQLASLKDRSPDVRLTAAVALGRLKDKSTLESLLTALSDPETEVRDQVINTLGNLGDVRAVSILLKLEEAKSSNPMVYYGALGRIGHASAIEPIIADIKRGMGEPCAAQALAEIGQPAFAALMAELSRTSGDERGLLLRGLMLGGSAAIRFLMRLAETGSVAERKMSGLALQWVGEWYPNDPIAGEVEALLQKAMTARDFPIIAGASSFFIRKGVPGTEEALAGALREHGDREMANEYLNCTNGKLILAAYEWSRRHGYKTIMVPGGGKTKWGVGK